MKVTPDMKITETSDANEQLVEAFRGTLELSQ